MSIPWNFTQSKQALVGRFEPDAIFSYMHIVEFDLTSSCGVVTVVVITLAFQIRSPVSEN
jgi:hypothetical protein